MNFLPFARGGRSQGAASSASEGSRVASRAGSRVVWCCGCFFCDGCGFFGPDCFGGSGLLMLATMTVRRVSAQQQAVGKLSRIIRGVRAARTGCTPRR